MENRQKLSDIISAFVKLVEQTPKIYDATYNAVATEDKLTTDLLHDMELKGKTCDIRSRIATELRKNRMDRRYYKDILEEYEPLYDFLQDPLNKKVLKNLEQVLGEIRKAENYHADRTYHPRVKKMDEEKNSGKDAEA